MGTTEPQRRRRWPPGTRLPHPAQVAWARQQRLMATSPARLQVCVSVCLYICTCVYVCLCVPVYMYVCPHVHVHACMCLCVHVSVSLWYMKHCVPESVCVHVYNMCDCIYLCVSV